MLTPREIIAEAWKVTMAEPVLRRWGLVGSMLRLLLDIKLISYQIYFLIAFIYGKEVGLFDDVIWLYERVSFPTFTATISAFLILVLIELLLPSFTDGAIIGLAAKAHKKEPVRGGLVLAIYNFFPVLTIHEIFIFSGVNLLVTAISILLRYGAGLTPFLIVMAVILWLLSSVLKFFANFAEPAVVIKKTGVFEAIGHSIKLVFSYPWHIIFLILLLLIITIRIFINVAVVIAILGVALGVGMVLGWFLPAAIGYAIATLLAIALIVTAGYFFTYLHIFKQTVWTIMYLELVAEKDLDTIG